MAHFTGAKLNEYYLQNRLEFPTRACTEVLKDFESCLTLVTSFYMIHVKFDMHQNLTTAGNFHKMFYTTRII